METRLKYLHILRKKSLNHEKTFLILACEYLEYEGISRFVWRDIIGTSVHHNLCGGYHEHIRRRNNIQNNDLLPFSPLNKFLSRKLLMWTTDVLKRNVFDLNEHTINLINFSSASLKTPTSFL